MRKLSYLIGLLLVIQVHAAPHLFGIDKDGKIDQAAIGSAYKNSDWDEARHALEGYLKRKGDRNVAIDERIFSYKYLGVILAADSLTKARSESYFHRLLDLSPKIEILDLFASKKINDFFQEVKRDHENQKAYSSTFDAYGHETQNPNAKPDGPLSTKDSMATSSQAKNSPQPIPMRQNSELKSSQSQTWVWWTVGVAAVAGIGATAYYLTLDDTPNRVVAQRDLTPK
jgi:hypothetical protein